MKRLILAFAFLTIILPPLVALARAGSYRSAIDRKWNEVQAWQKMQDALFKAIEREAAKGGAILRPDVRGRNTRQPDLSSPCSLPRCTVMK